MDSLQFWLYIIIGAIYVISQIRKKAREAQSGQKPASKPVQKAETTTTTTTWKQHPPTTAEPVTTQKPMTFEELLREITQAKAPAETTYEPYQETEYADYEVEGTEVLQEKPVTSYQQDPVYKQFQEAKQYDYAANPLEDTLKLEDVDMKYGKFREFEAEARGSLLDEYTRDLRDPDGFKKAVILSEILNRRHF
ncbi:MAG: hypothetical protein KF845_08350 [Cyclobacteriaceae bacterium]|nr:hypothetical protein [Cyclobacteriaceae bacterium]